MHGWPVLLARVKTLVWNGPFGAFELEPFDNGTLEVAEALCDRLALHVDLDDVAWGDTVEFAIDANDIAAAQARLASPRWKRKSRRG